MGEGVLRTSDLAELEKHLLRNPSFPPESVFVLRSRSNDEAIAIGLLVANIAYADPTQVDSGMPCFRLGAFGAEGMQTKRINGLFSILTDDRKNTSPLALDLMGHATSEFQETITGALAAQVPSDADHLLGFYERYFRRQGSFPIYERKL